VRSRPGYLPEQTPRVCIVLPRFEQPDIPEGFAPIAACRDKPQACGASAMRCGGGMDARLSTTRIAFKHSRRAVQGGTA